MLNNKTINILLASIFFALSPFAYADYDSSDMDKYVSKATLLNVGDQAEGVIYNPIKKTYEITYETVDINGKPFLYQTVYTPPTNVNATIRTKLYTDTDSIAYNFIFSSKEMENKESKQQDIILVKFNIGDSRIINGSVRSPNGWKHSYHEENPRRLNWLFVSNNSSLSIKPDGYLSGFIYKSKELPGVVAVDLTGNAPVLGLGGDIVNKNVRDKVDSLLTGDYVTTYASGPAIENPSPFNPVVVLNSIKQHIKALKSLDFVTEELYLNASELIDATIHAVTLNNEDAAEDFLEDLSKLLNIGDSDEDKEEHDEDGHEDSEYNEIIGVSSEVISAFNRSMKFTIDYIEDRL